MNIFNFSSNDVYAHFKNNNKYYFLFLIAISLSIAISIVVVITSDSYLSLLVSSNKNLYSYINGTAVSGNLFWNRSKLFLFPIILIFALGQNYYTCYLNYIFIAYQFTIFILTSVAVISMYYFSGIMEFIFLILPVNLIFFCSLIFLTVTCFEKNEISKRTRNFLDGFCDVYFIKILACFFVVIILTIIVTYLFPLILKSAIFSIY